MPHPLPPAAAAGLLVVLAACATYPAAPAPAPTVGPPPASPSALRITSVVLVSPAIPWDWRPETTPPALFASLHSPASVAAWLAANTTADASEDSTILSPAEFASHRRGACSVFARFWVAALAAQGIPATLAAAWGTPDAPGHAYALFPFAGRWRVASMASLLPDDIGADPTPPLAASARLFYGVGWGSVRTIDPRTGAITATLNRSPGESP